MCTAVDRVRVEPISVGNVTCTAFMEEIKTKEKTEKVKDARCLCLEAGLRVQFLLQAGPVFEQHQQDTDMILESRHDIIPREAPQLETELHHVLTHCCSLPGNGSLTSRRRPAGPNPARPKYVRSSAVSSDRAS